VVPPSGPARSCGPTESYGPAEGRFTTFRLLAKSGLSMGSLRRRRRLHIHTQSPDQDSLTRTFWETLFWTWELHPSKSRFCLG